MDTLFGLDKASEQKGLALVATVFSPAELAVVESILRDADIPYLAKERGAGGAIKIVMGFSMYGTDIFVRENDVETAVALLAPTDKDQEDEEDGYNND